MNPTPDYNKSNKVSIPPIHSFSNIVALKIAFSENPKKIVLCRTNLNIRIRERIMSDSIC